jgi:hypothetical protein
LTGGATEAAGAAFFAAMMTGDCAVAETESAASAQKSAQVSVNGRMDSDRKQPIILKAFPVDAFVTRLSCDITDRCERSHPCCCASLSLTPA